ncbi:MAG: lipid-A-disaccharide synthase [Epsilonproteobacteria bacterium]|nr:lipid-A-disaccharide synthase [Campylobacterota bacterium]
MKILVSALEHSANIHLKSLKAELNDDIELIGIFDASLGQSIVDLRSLAIMGFVDALKKLAFFIKLNHQMVKLAKDADKVLLIDSSGFNLPLAKKIRKKYPHKEIIYYILPQAWAWKPKRIPVLEKTITHLCSILPFERDYYSKTAPITYVGHPLLDQIHAFKEHLNPSVEHIAFMPGSRKGEIRKLMPVFRELQKLLGIRSTLIIPKHFTQNEIDELYGDISAFEIATNSHATLLEADFAFICSGTATLEASLIGIPFVLTYIAKPLDYFIASRLVKLNYIGLANIMFEKFKGEPLHPEFIQESVTPQNLFEAFHTFDREAFLEHSKELRGYLQSGSSKNVARIIQG